ncbi:hypothetical protein [Neisseria chenwenguii]|uniref:hypothetical protein n=1 Tax=Neisseria chenwenguii TaxID=1853278 RepID=UPI0012FD4DBF|nr:hypothetical protein [Neisseria chenwenguii]
MKLLYPIIFSVSSAALSFPAYAEAGILQQESQRQEALRQRFQPDVSVCLEQTEPAAATSGPQPDVPCFPIREVRLEGKASHRFQFALKKALRQTEFAAGNVWVRQASTA